MIHDHVVMLGTDVRVKIYPKKGIELSQIFFSVDNTSRMFT